MIANHLMYLADRPRNAAYRTALQGAVTGKVVLDLGCGTGVLGLIALAAGAKHVIAVDSDADILAEAKAIASEAGWSNHISYLNERITHALHPVWDDIDICVHEIIGNWVLEEKAGSVLRGVTKPLIPWGFGFRISLIDFKPCDFDELINPSTATVLARFAQRKTNINAPNPTMASLIADDPRYANVKQSYTTRRPFAFNDIIEGYTFKFVIGQPYSCLAVRIEGLLQFNHSPEFYAMVHQSPCSWASIIYLHPQLIDVEPGKNLIVTIAEHGIGVELR